MSSCEGSAVKALIERAEALEPDFSSKKPETAFDILLLDAPPMMGKFFALKRKLELEEKRLNPDEEEKIKDSRSDQSLCDHMASYELRKVIQSHAGRRNMIVRNTGVIVIVCRILRT